MSALDEIADAITAARSRSLQDRGFIAIDLRHKLAELQPDSVPFHRRDEIKKLYRRLLVELLDIPSDAPSLDRLVEDFVSAATRRAHELP